MCLLFSNSSPCPHPECYLYNTWQSLNYTSSIDLQLSEAILNQSNAFLTQLLWNYQKVQKDIDSVSALAKTISTNDKNQYLSDDDKSLVFESLNRTWKAEPFPFSLQMEKPFPARVYKERGFQLKFSIKTIEGCTAKLEGNQVFRIILTSTDDTPNILYSNISGKKIIRGTTESRQNEEGIIEFNNVVINEVSSHYTNGCFSLIVMCLENLDIKPFVRDKIYVRARKALKHRKVISK
ncbi:unnamed protein product [Blepharisma stoltei]|uniref:Uncharacterized protein n=1 Tax=Blepharisma stoltei TaxID=1481888 RepID=A0AAU9JWX7_9CILI|nr:unnamed protein product [Blepharisma stoltei]